MTWERVTSGWCEAGSWDPLTHRKRARWEGPITRTGGSLYCGSCKRAYEERVASKTDGVNLLTPPMSM